MEKWVIKNKKADFDKIVKECGVSEVIARCLVNKGLEEPEEINLFLNPKLSDMHDPFLLKDVSKACNILIGKIKENKKIRIIGDYDVDGVISTYVLYRTLKSVGAQVDYEIPDRIKDGYGINIQMVEAAHLAGIDTILTCDNGIVAIDQVELAKQYHMTVIITDHHNLFETEEDGIQLPQADAVINPKQKDCFYPYEGLCGAAIAYKLCLALIDSYDMAEKEAFREELLSYVAIATVCDVMELTGENRIIVRHGIEFLKKTQNKGLLSLMEVCSIVKEQLSAFHLGFIIGPCLNASGRLDTAMKGIKLLLASTKEEADLLANEVRSLNDLRKNMTVENVEKAIVMIEESDLKRDKVLVIYLQSCHESIAGIIAGRIREKYSKPTLVLTDAENCIKGSGRSIDSYNMIEELLKCRELFLKVGGHPMAAGLSLEPKNVEILRSTLNQNTTLTEDMLTPKVSIDILLPLGYVSEGLISELRCLEPFGKGNEKPVFAEKDLIIKSAFIIGKNASGIRFRVENQFGKEMEALYFGDVNSFFNYVGELYGIEEVSKIKSGRSSSVKLTITYFPKINEYNGFRSVQLMIQNYR
ncbi:MAG: single-stranded-DNA-specific exonuclease RecJ [Mobilitalea sp.]